VVELDDLARCEAVVERGLDVFIEVGTALTEIRERRLYRTEFSTFAQYCRRRWGMSRIRAHQLIGASSVATNVLTVVNTPPANERQARPLVSLEPDQQRVAWAHVIKTAPDGKPTAEHVRRVVAEMFPEDGRLDAGSSPPAHPDSAGIPDPTAACRVLQGNAKLVLSTLDIESDHCCLTSPPYFGHRDYGAEGQIGQERTVKEYIENLVEVFHEVKRILRPGGTLFIVIGDSYRHGHKLGIPDHLAHALERDDWRWRSTIIWAKAAMVDDVLEGSCMPGSQEDRCTSAYEVVLHLDRGKGSYFDVYSQLAISGAKPRDVWRINTESNPLGHFALMPRKLAERCIRLGTSDKGCCPACGAPWRRLIEKERVPTRPGHNSKVYVDPAGSPYARHNGSVIGNRDPKRHTTVVHTVGWRPGCSCGAPDTVPCRVLDPFAGLATTGVVAAELGRSATLVELNPLYCEQARERIRETHTPAARPANNDRSGVAPTPGGGK
jgi:DNA modification methylase